MCMTGYEKAEASVLNAEQVVQEQAGHRRRDEGLAGDVVGEQVSADLHDVAGHAPEVFLALAAV